MPNERKTENLVRNHFNKYLDQITKFMAELAEVNKDSIIYDIPKPIPKLTNPTKSY